jgi:MraZ protein
MFLGEYAYSLDSKARLTIPAKYRELMAPPVVVTRSPTEACLLVLPMGEWERLAAKLNNLPMADPNSALLRRIIFSAAEDVRADSQGRILINQRLREYAGIENEVTIVGVYTHLELWNPVLWEERVQNKLNEPELNAQLFATLGI